MRLRFGLYAFPFELGGVVADAVRAEECGFDVLATGDHIRHPRDRGVALLDGWSVLANWAAHTQKVRLAMLVSNLIYRDPVLLAKQAVAVDQLSNGRLDLGIGTGVYATDHLMAGVPEWSPGEKVGRLGEALEIVDGLLRGAITEYEGRYYRFEQASVSPGPVQNPRPPLTVGAESPRTLRLAARYERLLGIRGVWKRRRGTNEPGNAGGVAGALPSWVCPLTDRRTPVKPTYRHVRAAGGLARLNVLAVE